MAKILGNDFVLKINIKPESLAKLREFENEFFERMSIRMARMESEPISFHKLLDDIEDDELQIIFDVLQESSFNKQAEAIRSIIGRLRSLRHAGRNDAIDYLDRVWRHESPARTSLPLPDPLSQYVQHSHTPVFPAMSTVRGNQEDGATIMLRVFYNHHGRYGLDSEGGLWEPNSEGYWERSAARLSDSGEVIRG